MIVIYEPWARDNLHYEFNKNFLEIISKTYSNKKIKYFGDKNQIKLLQDDLKLKNVYYQEIEISIPNNKNKLKQIFREILNISKIKKEKGELYIITNYQPVVGICSKLLLKNFFKIGLFHGLDTLYTRKKYKILLEYAISYDKNKTKYFVLGESIKKNLLEIFPKLAEQLEYIDHPYTLKKISKFEDFKNRKIKIGTIGYATKDKGIQNYFDLIQKISNKERYEFHHVGKIEKGIEIPDLLVNYGEKNEILSNLEYENKISELDYIIFLYPNQSYKLTASGAILDAIKFGKPIMALKNDYFEYVDKKINKLGYLVEKIEDIMEILENNCLEREYKKIQKNIALNREKFSNEQIQKDFEEKIQKNMEIR